MACKKDAAQDAIAETIQQLINEKGMKNKAVAARIGLTEQQFSDMLNGRQVIRAVHIPMIADVLGVRIGDIYEREEEQKA